MGDVEIEVKSCGGWLNVLLVCRVTRGNLAFTQDFEGERLKI